MLWHRQIHQCKNICKNVEGARKGVGNGGYNEGKFKRCSKCEYYFLAKLSKFEVEYCPCCKRQLRYKPRRKSKNHRADLLD